MKKPINKVSINVDYLNEIVKKSNLKDYEFAQRLGKGNSYVSKLRVQGYTYENVVDLICILFKADKAKLVVQEKEEQPTVDEKQQNSFEELANRIDKLEEQFNAITNRLSEIKIQPVNNEHIDINVNEKAVLLLKRMMFAGGCEIADFRNKAKSYNIPDESCDYAIKYTNETLKYTVTKRGYGNNTKEWIIR